MYSSFSTFAISCFPGGSGKESACSAGDPVSLPGSRRSPGEGNGNPLQYPGLENAMDGGDWQTTIHGVAESDTTERLTLLHFHFFTALCNHHCHPPPKLCHHPKLKQCALNNIFPIPVSPPPDNHCSTLCLHEFDCCMTDHAYLSVSGRLISASNNVLNVRKLNVNMAGNPEEMNSE